MKLGCCLNMLGTPEDDIGQCWIDCAKTAGYDYVELPLAQVMALSSQGFDTLLHRLEQVGIPCESCNNFFPASVRLTGPDAEPERIGRYVDKALERAHRLGAKVIVFGSSGAKNVPEGFPMETAFQQIVEVLRMVGPKARQVGIEIVIEPLNRQESNIITNLTEGADLMRRVGDSQVALLVDYYHYAMEQETLSTLEQYLPLIRHVHFAEPVGRVIPTAPRKAYESFFAVLVNGGYNGRVSIEGYSRDPAADLPGTAFLRRYWHDRT